MLLALFACLTPEPPAKPAEEAGTARVELVREAAPYPLAAQGQQATLRHADGELLAAWISDGSVVATRISATSPGAEPPTEMGSVSADAGRPDIGTAEGRLLVAWDDGRGRAVVRGVLDTGELQDALPLSDEVVPGTLVLDIGFDGAGSMGFSDGKAFRAVTFDRLATTVIEDPPLVSLEEDDTVNAVADPDGGFAITWRGPAVDVTSTDPFVGLRAGRFRMGQPPTDTVLESAQTEQFGNAVIAVRADGMLAVAWVGRGFGPDPVSVWVRIIDPSGVAGVPVRVASGEDIDDPSITWAGQHVAVGWSGSRNEGEREVVLGVVDEAGEVLISWFPVSNSPFEVHRSAVIAAQPVNGGYRITTVWEVGASPELWGVGATLLVR